MPAHKLVISPAAKNDLQGIYQYGVRQWGQAQSDRYLAAFKEQFWSLTEQPLMGPERPELMPETRSLSIQSHTLFYRVTARRIEIVRILHGRQDPMRHLQATR